MSRRTSAPTRVVLPDPKFGSEMLAKFMNMVMERGKKSVAERIVYGAIDRMAEKTGRPAEATLDLLTQALDNVKPAIEGVKRAVETPAGPRVTVGVGVKGGDEKLGTVAGLSLIVEF